MRDFPSFSLNPAIDQQAARGQFASDGRIQIPNVLTPDSALAARRMLADETVWGIKYCEDRKRFLLPGRGLAKELAGAAAAIDSMLGDRLGSTKTFAYVYATHDYSPKGVARDKEDALGQHVMRQMNQPAVLDLVRDVTGERAIGRASANITLFRPRHFLRVHLDGRDGRCFGFVLNLCSREWKEEWGGHLLFHDSDGNLVARFPAGFNALTLFDIEQRHSVSVVAKDAPPDRLAVSGWFYESTAEESAERKMLDNPN